MSKQRDVWEWLMKCPVFPRLFYAFSSGTNGDVQLSPIGGIIREDWLTRYIDGSGEKTLDYELAQFMPAPVLANSPENVDILETFSLIAKWIEEQDNSKKYPFDSVNTIQMLNSGQIAAQDETGAKYTFQLRITFYQYKKG